MYIGLILLILNIILSFSLMSFLNHVGIALATSIVSWIGTIIYISLLLKAGKIIKPTFLIKDQDINLVSVLFYGLKITLVSCLMILSMRLVLHVLELTNINQTFLLLILCMFGFFMYILTSHMFKYIPQELSDFISMKFKKAK